MKQWRIAIENNSNLRQENEKLKLALEKKGLEIKKINLAAKSNVSEIGALKTKVSNLEDIVIQLQSDLDKAQKKASENEKQSVNAKFIRELDEINELVSKHGQRKLSENRANGIFNLSKTSSKPEETLTSVEISKKIAQHNESLKASIWTAMQKAAEQSDEGVKTHITPAGETLFNCNFCPSKFSTRQHLESHGRYCSKSKQNTLQV